MKFFLVFIVSLLFFQNSIQVLYWKAKRKHSWTDFRGYPPSNSARSAQSIVGFEISYNLVNDTLYFKCRSNFNCTASWYKKNEVTPALLRHEDLHFDINEAYARSLKKLVKETEFTEQDYAQKLSKMIRYVQKDAAEYQKAYDNETNHSFKQDQQQKWDHKILTDLVSLKNYSDSIVKKPIKK